jgi:Tol biopolymer transport system component
LITLLLSGIFSLAALTDGFAQSTTRVTVSSGGVQGNGDSFAPSISTGGSFVAFSSDATNLVTPSTTIGRRHIFVRDRQTNQTTLVSVSSGGVQGDGDSVAPSISSNGDVVAFQSAATNLVANDTTGHLDIFVHEISTGTTTLVSVSSGGVQGDGDSVAPSISTDGRFVAFSSDATNLVANDTNGLADIFVHDRQTGQTTRVSVDSSGTQATGGASSVPSISSDGRFIAFESLATNLVTGDTNGSSDIFVRDQGGSFLGSGGAGGGGSCFIDTAAGCISRNLGRALFLLVVAAAFAAAVRLKTR